MAEIDTLFMLLLTKTGFVMVAGASPERRSEALSFHAVLGERGLIAVERLMGMILVAVSIQMLLTGWKVAMKE